MRCFTLCFWLAIGCGDVPLATDERSRDTAVPVQSTFDLDEPSADTDTGAPEEPSQVEDTGQSVEDTGGTSASEPAPEEGVTELDLDGDGLSEAQGDCDDTDAQVHPLALEVCDGLDNDCDGEVDGSNAIDARQFFADADSDGFGDRASSVMACTLPEGAVANDMDCDDMDDRSYPGGIEVCDGVDNDCDGTLDPSSSADSVTWFRDRDMDGFGSAEESVSSCSAPGEDYSLSAGDCDDEDPLARPDATEVCDEIDNDCDGEIDEGEAAPSIWYEDSDGDGYGDPDNTQAACELPGPRWVGFAGDCDDLDVTAHPEGVEVCDEVDNDCDGEVDEGEAAPSTWYKDSDGDGYGDPDNTQAACELPGPRWVGFAGDCDDLDVTAHPDGVEVCDGADNDCDGEVDPDTSLDAMTWFVDADADGYGVETDELVACEPPSDAYTTVGLDCNDESRDAYPGAPEVCDEIDNDCDGDVDEGDAAPSIWYRDADEDGYGSDSSAQTACEAPGSRYVSVGGDCKDADSEVHPAATEWCTIEDRNCDGDPGNGAVTWFNVSGIPTDMTESMDDPSNVLRLEHSGELWICEGAPSSRIVTSGADVSIHGSGERVGLYGSDDGPVIRALAGTESLTVKNLYISNGRAVKGGGIRVKNAEVVVENTTVAFNEAEEQGGGIYIESGSLELIDSTVMYNFVLLDGYGAGIRIETGDVDAVDSLIEYNMGVGSVYGGGISVQSGRVSLDGSKVKWNDVSMNGGGIAVAEGDVRLQDSKIRDNHADHYGGGVRVGGNLIMDNTMFRGNSASLEGGAVSLRGVDGEAPMLSCTADDDVGAGFRQNWTHEGQGGAVHSPHSWIEIDSFTCDWGQGEDNNTPNDISTHYLTGNTGANATFECTSAYNCEGDVRTDRY